MIPFRQEAIVLSRLESLFRLEVEFHRCLRGLSASVSDLGGLHTSYALQAGYEPLLMRLGIVTAADVEHLPHQLSITVDSRDALAAVNSLKQLLGIP